MAHTDQISVRRFELAVVVATAFGVQVTISFLAACPPILAPEIARDRAWNLELIGFYPTLMGVTAFLISFRVPALLKRLGGMGLALACVVSNAFGLLCLLAPSFSLLVATPLAVGLASGSMNAASTQVVGPRTPPKSAGLVLSIKQTGVTFGGVFAGMVVPAFVLYLGWQYTIWVLAAASGVMVFLLHGFVPWLNGPGASAGQTSFSHPLEPAKRLIAIPGMLPLLLAGMPFSAMMLCMRTFLVPYLVKDVGLSLELAGVFFSVSQAAGMVGQIAWATLSDRWLSAQRVMMIVGILMATATALTAVLTSQWPIWGITAVVFLYGLTAAGFLPVVFGEVARKALPGDVGALTSATQVFFVPAVIIAPLIFSALASMLDYSTAFVFLAVWALAGSVVLMAYR